MPNNTCSNLYVDTGRLRHQGSVLPVSVLPYLTSYWTCRVLYNNCKSRDCKSQSSLFLSFLPIPILTSPTQSQCARTLLPINLNVVFVPLSNPAFTPNPPIPPNPPLVVAPTVLRLKYNVFFEPTNNHAIMHNVEL